MAPKQKGKRETAPRKTVTRKTAQKKSTQTWVITTSGDRPLADIAKDLSAAGFAVDQTLEQIGAITWKSDAKAVGKARAIRGVTDVSPVPLVDIGPPNSRDTW